VSDGGTTDRAHSAASRGGASFSTRTIASADAISQRSFDRFAPADNRGAGMGALSFSDRLMQPYFASAQRHRQRVAPGDFARRPVTEDVTWLFPVPWYSDELSWLMAEAAGSGASTSGASTSGSPSRARQPSQRTSARPAASARTRSAAPRAFSPLVPLAAISAAELVADLFSARTPIAEQTALASVVPELTFLSASDWSRPSPRARRQPRAAAAASPPPAIAPALAPVAEALPPVARDVGAATSDYRAPTSARVRAVELLAEASRAGDLERTRFAASPPMAMQAGLTQLDDAVAAAREVEAPLLRYARPRPSAAPTASTTASTTAPTTAPTTMPLAPRWTARPTVADVLSSPPSVHAALAAAAERPRSIAHVVWADRWLARFAGAASSTVSTLAAAAAPSAPGFESVFVTATPELRRAAPASAPTPAASAARTPAAPIVGPYPQPTPIDQLPVDDEPVSDEVFAAISQQLAQDRKPGVWAAQEHRVPAGPHGVAPSALTQRALATPVAWRSPGLAPGLGSSPVMPALSATIDAPLGPTFDVRALTLTPAVAAAMAIESSSERTRAIESLAAPATATPSRLYETLAAYAPEPVYLSGADAPGDPSPRGTGDPALLAAPPYPHAFNAPSFAGPPAQSPEPASPVASAARARAEIQALVRRSPTPGAVGQLARSFGIERSLAAADLSYDFVPPEVISAARVYGFDAHDAVRAVRLAESGDAPLAALKDAVAMTFIQAVSPSVTATRAPVASTHRGMGPLADGSFAAPAPTATALSAGATPQAAVDPTVDPSFAAPPLSSLAQAAAALPASVSYGASQLVAPRRARGATLWPDSALASLGISARQVAQHPGVESALEVLAAGAVADAAVWVHAMEPGLDLEDAFAPTHAALRHSHFAPAPVEPLADPQLSLFDLMEPPGTAAEMPLVAYDPFPDRRREDVREAEGPEGVAMPPVEAGYDPFPDRQRHEAEAEAEAEAEQRELAIDAGAGPGDVPWIRAALSALPAPIRPAFESIYAALAGDPQTRALPPAERAARALAVARRSTSDQPMSARARAAMAWSVLPTVIAGGSPAEIARASGLDAPAFGFGFDAPGPDAPPRGPGVYADELTPIAAAPPRRREPPQRPAHYPAPTAAPTLVRTGPSAQMYQEAASRAAAGERVAQAAMPTMSAIANTEGIPEWFLEAAKHLAEDAPSSSSSGITLAEMTLVTAMPKTSMAASPRTASASSPAPGGDGDPSSAAGGEDVGERGDFNLDKAANEIVRRLKDYFDIQRMRNGER
jgi:hypothetical protein